MKQNELCDSIIISAKSIIEDAEELKEKEAKIRKDERIKVIDDFVSEIRKHHYLLRDRINDTDYGMFTCGIETIAEQLKEQKK